MRHVDTNLVGAPRLQHQLHQGVMGKALDDAIMGNGKLAGFPDRIAFAVGRMPTYRFLDPAASSHAPPRDRKIFPRDLPFLQLLR